MNKTYYFFCPTCSNASKFNATLANNVPRKNNCTANDKARRVSSNCSTSKWMLELTVTSH